MSLFRRFMYLCYYLKQGELKKTKKFSEYVAKLKGKPRLLIIFHSIIDVFKFNISIKDYYQFRFYNLKRIEKSNWAGSGFMYEFQLKMNPRKNRSVLENKIEFLNLYKEFIRRKYSTLDMIQSNIASLQEFIKNGSKKLVLKGSKGQVGAEVEVIQCSEYSPQSLVEYMKDSDFDMVEEYVVQHDELMKLSPSGLNTVRVFTQLNNGKVDFLGARLRVTVNSPVDNMAAGNIAAPIDMESGVVCGAGVFSDIMKDDVDIHPITKVSIKNFQIPFWKEVVQIVERAALFNQDNKSIGWDVAITNAGPELIEGNHNWCKTLWQLPVKKGLKSKLLAYQ